MEIEKLKIQKEIKELELKILESKPVSSSWAINRINPTILVAVIGLFGTLLTIAIQISASNKLENRKFEYGIYLQAQNLGEIEKAAKFLDFYVQAGIIPGRENQYSNYLKEGEYDKIPFTSNVYKNISLPMIEIYDSLILKDNFVIGKGTKYQLTKSTWGEFEDQTPKNIIIASTVTNDLNQTADYYTFFAPMRPETQGKGVSPHLLIGNTGRIIQLIPFNYSAIGAANNEKYRNNSILIQLVNWGPLSKNGSIFTNAYNQKVDSQNITQDPISKKLYWDKFSDEQITALKKVCQLLILKYKIQEIKLRSEIDNKPNPGPFIPINDLRNLLNVNEK